MKPASVIVKRRYRRAVLLSHLKVHLCTTIFWALHLGILTFSILGLSTSDDLLCVVCTLGLFTPILLWYLRQEVLFDFFCVREVSKQKIADTVSQELAERLLEKQNRLKGVKDETLNRIDETLYKLKELDSTEENSESGKLSLI